MTKPTNPEDAGADTRISNEEHIVSGHEMDNKRESKLLSDEELEKLVLDEWLVHDEDCESSLWGERCTCIQSNVAKNLVPIINTQKRLYAEMAISLDAEALMRVGNKSDSYRSHVPAYIAIIEEQRARIVVDTLHVVIAKKSGMALLLG